MRRFVPAILKTEDSSCLSAESRLITNSSVVRFGNRQGLTLLEVLVSTAIFMGSLAVVLQLLSVGKRAEMMTRLQSEAVMRAETRMSEVIAGIQELTTVNDEVFPDSDGSGSWVWSLETIDTGTTGLLQITVTVKYVVGDDDAVATYSLTRYMRDPQIFIDAALAESAE